MEREALKAATSGRGTGSRGKGGKAGAETRVSDALGQRTPVTLAGREFTLQPLNFGDLRRIEERYDSTAEFFAQVSGLKISALGFLFWLFLRKGDPALTEEALDELLPVQEEALLELLAKALSVSGLTEKNGTRAETAAP